MFLSASVIGVGWEHVDIHPFAIILRSSYVPSPVLGSWVIEQRTPCTLPSRSSQACNKPCVCGPPADTGGPRKGAVTRDLEFGLGGGVREGCVEMWHQCGLENQEEFLGRKGGGLAVCQFLVHTHTQIRSSVSVRSAVTFTGRAWVIGPGRASAPAPSRDSPSCFSGSYKGPACLEHVGPGACLWGAEWTGCPPRLETENVIAFVIDLRHP